MLGFDGGESGNEWIVKAKNSVIMSEKVLAPEHVSNLFSPSTLYFLVRLPDWVENLSAHLFPSNHKPLTSTFPSDLIDPFHIFLLWTSAFPGSYSPTCSFSLQKNICTYSFMGLRDGRFCLRPGLGQGFASRIAFLRWRHPKLPIESSDSGSWPWKMLSQSSDSKVLYVQTGEEDHRPAKSCVAIPSIPIRSRKLCKMLRAKRYSVWPV